MTAVLPESSAAQADARETLAVVGDSALRLLAGFPSTPSALRIRVGEVTIEAEWADTDTEITATSAPAPALGSTAAPAAPSPVDPAVRYVAAPMVGVFYRAPEPGAPPFVEVGTKVKTGDQVGIVEAMKLMVPVHADAPGTVTEILKENGEGIEYGENLIAYVVDH